MSRNPLKITHVEAPNASKKLLARFSVANNADTPDSLYFFPDLFFENVILYKIEKNKATALPVIAPVARDSISYRLFIVLPHDTVTLLAECYPLRTYTSSFYPNIFRRNYLETFDTKLQMENANVRLFTYVFCGLLLMMILFSLANFLQGRNREFLYYAAYAFFLGLMLFTKQFYYNRSTESNFFFESYMDFVLQILGICFFMAFMIRFLETKKDFPFLHKLYIGGIIFLTAVILLYSYVHYSSIDYYWENFLENIITKNILVVLIVVFLVYAVKNWRHKLLRYLFWGNLLYLVFSLLSLLSILGGRKLHLPGILSSSLILYEVGLLIELIFFLMGLTYKNRTQLIEQTTERERLKMENERKELEKQVAVMQAHQEERERISADIHDELGSGMTTIRLMSEIAKNKMKENVPVEIEKISNSANEVLNKMNAIVWSMNSSNDTLDSLISYIRAYTYEFFDGTPIECKVKMPDTIPFHEISGDKRRNVFLCVKESLNNVLKHSKASRLNIDIEANHKLKIKIADNGVGIEQEKIRRFGNGLKNIEKRMKGIGGNYTIANNNGTETKLELPL
ncbi:MAG TPA: 7TM diverse intracellular signaling domain-containing protein [Chitinophagaceae bacterium]|nr:7TM diverse intracellular signaling domain-containing protein [Chitinophagaceae bacterium]